MNTSSLPCRDVAIHFLRDGGAVAFDESTQGLFAFDRTAAVVWCALLDGGEDAAIAELVARTELTPDGARDVVRQCLARWRRVGLVGEPRGGVAGRTATMVPTVAAEDVARRDDFAAPAARWRLVVAGVPYDVRVERDHLAGVLAPLLGDFPRWDPATVGDNELEGRIDVVAVGETGAAVYFDGWLADECAAVAQLAPMIKFCLTGDRVDGAGDSVAVHGGLVTWPDTPAQGVLLAGPAGSGKSTLAAGLVGAGYGHASDDTVLFEPVTQRFRGFGFAAGIKAGAWPVLAPHFPALTTGAIHERSDGLAVRFLARGRPVDGSVGVDTVVFPTHTDGASPNIRSMDTATALKRLLAESGSGTGHLTAAALVSFAAWLDGTRIAAVTYCSLADGIDAMASLRERREAAA